MKKMLLLTAGLLLLAATAFAGNNVGTSAYLSWSATSNVTDTSNLNPFLYVRYVAAVGKTFDFYGAEVKIHWSPVGDGAGCWDVTNTVYKTSAGTTCTYLNRGTAVPVATINAGDADIAWANTAAGPTGCTAGAIVQVQFENDTCADPSGCVGLDYASVLDSGNQVDLCTLAGPVVTVAGGGGHQCVTATEPSTWGKIKSVFKN